MKNYIHSLFLIFSLLLLSCNNKDNKPSNLEYTNLKTIEIGDYSLQVPAQFNIQEEQGIDSYVGYLSGSGIELQFDYGVYTNPSENLPPEQYDVFLTILGSVEKQIVVGKNPNENFTGLHIRDMNNFSPLGNYVSLNMSIVDITEVEQDLVVQILESAVIIP